MNNMNDLEFRKLVEEFKKHIFDLEIDETIYYEKQFGDFLLTFEYDIWCSDISKEYFSSVDCIEVYDVEKDEEVYLTNLQLDELEIEAKNSVYLEYEEYESPEDYSYSYGGL